MTRSLFALLMACALSTAMSTAFARDIERLSAADAGDCPADLAAAKADAADKRSDTAKHAAKPSQAPVHGKPTVRGTDATPAGGRLQAPRWHSFLPGMFR